MAITNGYATLTEIKSRLDIDDTDNDAELETVIEAVSRWIDHDRDRRIYTASETRYYTPEFADYLVIDDLVTLTTLKTDDNADGTYENTWASTDYHLLPANAALDTKPYSEIRTALNGNYTFPRQVNSVEVVGTFGYASTTPDGIKEACILASMRVWKRRDVLYGTSGNAALGTVDAIAPIMRDGELKVLLNTVPRRLV